MNWLSGLRLCSFILLASLVLSAEEFPSEQQRLVSVARLWVAVKYFHPYIASRPVDWDKPLIEALPAIRSATSDAELKSAVQSLLAPLNDELTTVLSANTPAVQTSAPAIAQRSWIHHGLPSPLPSAGAYYQAFTTKLSSAVETAQVALSPNLTAQIRLSEPVPAANTAPAPQPDRNYADTPYPSTELRILSAFRIWGVIHNFFGYKDLMDEDWDRVFAEALPKFIQATDARSYHLAIAEIISRLSDSNSTVSSPELDRYFGEAALPLTIRLIEKKVVVTGIHNAAAKAVGLQIGDTISAVDGERISDRIRREANYLSASTAQGLSAAVVNRLLNGPEGSKAELTIAHADDAPRKVSLQRSTANMPRDSKNENAIRILPANIGYADLTHVGVGDVDDLFDKLHGTASIIFDARGPIAPLSSQIASCVATHGQVATAIVTGPLSLEPDLPKPGLSTSTSSYFTMETFGGECRHPYKGKTVMLIDERTVSSAEHLGLALAAVNNTEFLGTPSAGADSAVTEFTAPGGITIRFSGQDVRYANGGPIQRMGLQPTLALAPKIAAIRSHRDPVLEKAQEYLRPSGTQAKLEFR